MEYFFLPGRLRDLSWVELNSVCKITLGSQYVLKDKGTFFILETELELSFVQEVFSRLGGFLKFGKVLEKDIDIKELAKDEKVIFGISSYSKDFDFNHIKKLTQDFKNQFIKSGKKARFVLPKDDTSLNATQVLKNNIIDQGFELVILDGYEGQTLGVQDIEGFSSRDYDKPFVDEKMGVLPVKLARIMVNLAGIKKGGALWDPFCGSGNVLLEGLALGYDVFGSDIDFKSLEGSKKNISWVKKKFNLKNEGQIFYLDILNPTISKLDIIKNSDFDGIVCEPYMGKPQRRPLPIGKAQNLANQHSKLVQSLFLLLDALQLSGKINVVVIFPKYKTKEGWFTMPENKMNFKNAKIIEKDLHWSRINSIIKRQIFVFEYKSK